CRHPWRQGTIYAGEVLGFAGRGCAPRLKPRRVVRRSIHSTNITTGSAASNASRFSHATFIEPLGRVAWRMTCAQASSSAPASFNIRIAVRVITRTVHRRTAIADGDGGVREELASGLSDVLFMQQIIRKANHGALKDPLFRCVIVSVRAFCHWSERTPLGP